MSIQIGQPAPEFSLYDTTKTRRNLSEWRGINVVILFFPQAFTSVCTEELCNVRDNIALYDMAGAQVLGISVDSIFTLAKFREEQQYNFPLLSDFNKEVSRSYDALYEDWILDMKGVSKRSAFIIDKEGIVRYAEVLENAGEVPDFKKIEKLLTELN